MIRNISSIVEKEYKSKPFGSTYAHSGAPNKTTRVNLGLFLFYKGGGLEVIEFQLTNYAEASTK